MYSNRFSSSSSSSSGARSGGDNYGGGGHHRTSSVGAVSSAASPSGFGSFAPQYVGDEDDWRGRSDGAQAIHQLVMRCCWGPRRT